MRDIFPQFYRPSEEDLRRFLTRAVVVPDANVLLDLYRLSTTERDQVLDALASVGERLWAPYQVGLEYQRNRMIVIQQQASSYQRLVDLAGTQDEDGLQAALAKISSLPDEIREEASGLLPLLAQRLAVATEEFRAQVVAIRDTHVVTREQGLSDDPVRRRLDEVLDGRVGSAPAADVHAKRIADGIKRMDAKTPPGFKDDKKDTDERRVGDYLLWAQILDQAESLSAEKRDFLFVTSDVKEDWFEKWGGKPTGPLPALIAEFKTRTEGDYHQVTLAEFLSLTNRYLSTKVAPATIEKANTFSSVTMKEIATSDATRVGAEWLERFFATPRKVPAADAATIRAALEAASLAQSSSVNISRDDRARIRAARQVLNYLSHAPSSSAGDKEAEPDDDGQSENGDND